MRRWRRIVWGLMVAGVVGLGLAACSADQSASDNPPHLFPTRTLIPATPTPTALFIPSTPTPTDLPAPSALLAATAPPASGANLPAVARAQIERATADWAAELDVIPSEIHLVSLEAFLWRDASWGCAALAGDEPLDSALTRGYRVILEYNNRIMVYHTDDESGARQCPDRDWLAREGHPILTDPIVESMVTLARADVARRLNVTASAPRAISVLAVTWPDASLGCPKAGITYDAVPTRGYRLVFEVNATRLIYHTSIRDLVVCAPEEEILPGALRQALPQASPAS